MKIIENFVENDEVLGQLLDFISQRNGSSTQNESSNKAIDPDISMTMIDKQGNKIIQYKPQQQPNNANADTKLMPKRLASQ